MFLVSPRHAGLLLLCATAVLAPAARAQGPGPQKFENLKYFPADIPRDTLLTRMRGIAGALGVRCAFCHVEQEGQNGRPQLKPALDDKETKIKARYMLRMVDSINNVLLVALPGRSNPPVRVTCVTCHRGLSKPATLQSTLSAAIEKGGVDSATALYRHLRETSLVSGTYDFSEGSLNALAAQLADHGRADDALAMLKLNQEFYPNAGSVDFQMAEIYRQKGDKDNAITRYRLALQKEPNNQFAKRRLTELGANP